MSKGHEFELASEDGEGQGILACCSPWGHKEADATERLKSNNSLLPAARDTAHTTVVLKNVFAFTFFP